LCAGFDFQVDKLINKSNSEAMLALNEWISKASYDDLLLIYFSGHGKLSLTGDLFLTCFNTNSDSLLATAIKYSFILDLIRNYSVQKVAILLDCCYAGRALKDGAHRGTLAEQVEAAAKSVGSGVFVLGASGWSQSAEEREADGHGIFTKHVVDGLSSGDADRDGDVDISANDLSVYVAEKMASAPHQPMQGGSSLQGKIILGSNLRKKLEAAAHIIAVSVENNRNHFNRDTMRGIEDYIEFILKNGSDEADPRKVFVDRRYSVLMDFAQGRGNIDLIVRTFIDVARNSRWDASFLSRKGNSFLIKIKKGDEVHNVEFRAKTLRTDQLAIDGNVRSALRWPGINSHKFVLGSNPSEKMSIQE
jgi:hypothetical protein